jgi:hypothetical protein
VFELDESGAESGFVTVFWELWPHVLRRQCADARDPISSFRIAANISETEN